MAPKNSLEKRMTKNEEEFKELLRLVETAVANLLSVHQIIQTSSMTYLTTLEVLGGRLSEIEERLYKIESATEVKEDGTSTRRNSKN